MGSIGVRDAKTLWPARWSLDLPTPAEFRPHTGPPDTGDLFDSVQLGGAMLDSFRIFRLIFSPALLWHIPWVPAWPCRTHVLFLRNGLPHHSPAITSMDILDLREWRHWHQRKRCHEAPVAVDCMGVELHLAYGSELHLLTSLASMAVSPLRPMTRHLMLSSPLAIFSFSI